jgi:hypothetical protein
VPYRRRVLSLNIVIAFSFKFPLKKENIFEIYTQNKNA